MTRLVYLNTKGSLKTPQNQVTAVRPAGEYSPKITFPMATEPSSPGCQASKRPSRLCSAACESAMEPPWINKPITRLLPVASRTCLSISDWPSGNSITRRSRPSRSHAAPGSGGQKSLKARPKRKSNSKGPRRKSIARTI